MLKPLLQNDQAWHMPKSAGKQHTKDHMLQTALRLLMTYFDFWGVHGWRYAMLKSMVHQLHGCSSILLTVVRGSLLPQTSAQHLGHQICQ